MYCRAVFERGTGLGNRLFPWARCVVFARGHGAAMINPVWSRLAVGQLFRGGIDYESYLRQLVLFRLFRGHPDNLSVLSGVLKRRGALRIDEHAAPRLASAAPDGNLLVTFAGLGAYFESLAGKQELLLRELRSVTRKKYRRVVESVGEVPIGLCVRCGNDYREANNHRYGPLGPSDKTPLKWYVATLELIRRHVGRPVPALVVSDGTRDMLKPLLAMENVRFVRPGAAISDLLVLTKAKVLLTPGASSFAAWASFLGQMPSVSHPGQPLAVWHLPSARGQFLGELNPDIPTEGFLRQVAEALTATVS